MCAGSSDSKTAVFIPVDENVTQIVVQAELQETVAGACNGPSVLVVVAHDQAMILCAIPESAVVVGTSTGTVLDAQNVIMVVHHLMEQCGTDFFDGAGKGTGANVDLMGGTFLADPGVIPKGEMPVCLGCRLDGNGWS